MRARRNSVKLSYSFIGHRRNKRPAPPFSRSEIALSLATARYNVFCLSPHSLQV
jgi:hypothetical protein